ncbi:MAG: oxidoreductase domain protein [Verrucomicrobiales bacterium]|nr:oxidoreductase domain protein [Verrucomicrobiales bacterium]
MKELRFGIIGTGFWARYQLAAWRELKGARCVAVCDRDLSKARALASNSGINAVYENAEALIKAEKPDFLDVISNPGTHVELVKLAANHKIPVICQKPMAPTLAEAREMMDACRSAGVPLSIHENWRWQAPIRAFQEVLTSGIIGRVFRARIDYCNSFPVFDNQPFLKELDEFILSDMGSHIFDVARFLFGEASNLYCQTQRVHPGIKGEDAASVMLRMDSGTTVTCNLSYASRLEHDRFPETFLLVEGQLGSVQLAPDYWLRVTTSEGTRSRRCPPPFYPWADPRYALVHSSIVACHANLLGALQIGTQPETSGDDNFKTLQLVHASYESARHDSVVQINSLPHLK